MFTLPSGTALPGGRSSSNRVDDAILADAFAALDGAAVDTIHVLGIADTKGKAGSTSYAYRNALLKRGIAARGWSRPVKELRDALAAAEVPVPDELANAPAKHHVYGVTRAKGTVEVGEDGTPRIVS